MVKLKNWKIMGKIYFVCFSLKFLKLHVLMENFTIKIQIIDKLDNLQLITT